MHKNLVSFLDTNNIITKHQFGFRSGLSTFQALNQLHNYILRLNDSGHTCGIFLDLKKAFGIVNHKILLDKLNHYGNRGLALDFFTSYLKNRQQFVFANGVQSDKMQITCGVPQVSSLGPVLFLLYINDLPLFSNLFCNIFADDTALLISDTDPNNLENKTNIEIHSVFNWLQKNKLTLNLSKTKTILFNNHNRPVTLNINCNNVPLEQVNSTKYLGTTLIPI